MTQSRKSLISVPLAVATLQVSFPDILVFATDPRPAVGPWRRIYCRRAWVINIFVLISYFLILFCTYLELLRTNIHANSAFTLVYY